jgi:phosphate transport system substrate-binding protein
MQGFFSVAIALARLSVGTAVLSLSSCTPVIPTDNQTESQPQQTIKISGSGSVYPPLQVLAKAYEKKAKDTQITFLPGNQTSGGIIGVKDGLVEIGAASRQLKPEEKKGAIESREIARDALMVATHPSVTGVTNLRTRDLKAIYRGAIANWRQLGGPDAAIVVLDRPEDESAKQLLRQYYLGNTLKITTSAVILQQEPELIDALQNTPYSIGAFSAAYATANQLPVNRLSLNNVAPTVENVIAGKYKMVRKIIILWKNPPSTATQKFIAFMSSKKGAEALQKSSFAPSTPTK